MQEGPMVTGVDPSFIALVAIVGGVLVLSILFFMAFLQAILKDRQKEMTTREIAAYVAEGSISSEDAERILHGSRPWHEIREIARAGKRYCESQKAGKAAPA
ncbi:hypothetical protein AY599_28315 [Leptolyngbya valderiana BDU 20041]|nr:hypothetical protein AY599_28315 [Leptolyngbya valderiana BDU 20041]